MVFSQQDELLAESLQDPPEQLLPHHPTNQLKIENKGEKIKKINIYLCTYIYRERQTDRDLEREFVCVFERQFQIKISNLKSSASKWKRTNSFPGMRKFITAFAPK